MSRRLVIVAVLLALVWACSEPPDKEIHQAQGAIDAARAAGAEQYAPAALTAATTSLTQAHDAVEQGDYRLALSQALQAQENARSAARAAASQKAVVRSQVERTLDGVDAALTQAAARLKAARGRGGAAASALQTRIGSATAAVQKARSALEAEQYLAARDALDGVLDGLNRDLTALDQALTSRRRH